MLALLRSAAGPDPIGHEAYIWQRHWTPSLTSAIDANADLFRAWHVLAAEVSASGRVARSQANWPQVLASGRRVVPVVRIEGRIETDREASLVADIVAVMAAWPAAVQQRLEVDHDSATSQLAGYAHFLGELRQALRPGTTLSITILPTWLTSPDFASVADAADLLVLQVHSIDDPRTGLFDTGRATAWVAALARLTRRPFLVALPAYGARVAANPAGKLLAVSAEMHALDGEAGAEIAASPAAIMSFLAVLRRDPPDGFRGVVWFRLPTADDSRTWSAGTLRAVVLGQQLQARIDVVVRPGWVSGMSDILLVNQAEVDAPLPGRVRLPASCKAADGVGQYELDGASLRLRGNASGLLRPHEAALAGWIRCSDPTEGFHVEE